MRVAVLSLTDPWHAPHGGTLRTRAIVDAVARHGHDVVTVFPAPEGRAEAPRAPAGPPPGVRVVAVPAPTLGTRAWPEWVRRAKRTLVPLPTSLGGRSPALATALRDLAPVDLLVVSVLPFARYAEDLPGTRLWVDHSDLYSDVIAREAARRSGVARLTAMAQLHGVRRREDALVRDAALTTAAGAADADALARRSGGEVDWLPTPVAGGDVAAEPRSRPVAGFFANFGYWPNVDALVLLRERWAPRLTDLGWDVLVAGLGSDEVDAGPLVRVLGPVASPRDFYRSVDVTVAPVRVGGGMKVKVVESLAHGRPVVGTAFAAAGFPPGLAAAVEVVDPDEPDFAALREGPPPLPADLPGQLEPFTRRGFRSRVGGLLERASRPGTGSGADG